MDKLIAILAWLGWTVESLEALRNTEQIEAFADGTFSLLDGEQGLVPRGCGYSPEMRYLNRMFGSLDELVKFFEKSRGLYHAGQHKVRKDHYGDKHPCTVKMPSKSIPKGGWVPVDAGIFRMTDWLNTCQPENVLGFKWVRAPKFDGQEWWEGQHVKYAHRSFAVVDKIVYTPVELAFTPLPPHGTRGFDICCTFSSVTPSNGLEPKGIQIWTEEAVK